MKAQWKVNTPQLLQEIMTNPGTWILSKPLTIFQHILAELAERSAQLNDPQLNAIMCRLALYEIANPNSKDFDPKLVNNIIDTAAKLKNVATK